MGKIATVGFDYEGLDKDTKSKLLALAGQVKRGNARYAAAAIEIGCAVHEAHELLAGDGRDGKFSKWCEEECGIERRTAYNYLWAFERFNKCETVSHFSAGAMYALAAPTAPEKAVKEAIKMAERGQRITKALADEILEKHTVEDEPTPRKPVEQSEPEIAVSADAATDSQSSDSWQPPDGVTKYNDTFAPPTEPESLDLAAKQKPYDEMLNALTQISRIWGGVTKDERDGVYAIDKRQRVEVLIRDLRAPIAQARPHGICTHCEGKGCKKCQNCGWWPRSVVESLRK